MHPIKTLRYPVIELLFLKIHSLDVAFCVRPEDLSYRKLKGHIFLMKIFVFRLGLRCAR